MAYPLRTALYVSAGSVGVLIYTDDLHPVSVCLYVDGPPRKTKTAQPIRHVKRVYVCGVIREGTLEAVPMR